MMKGDVFMFNRNSGYHKPYMAHPMGVAPGANVMGTFKGKKGFAPNVPAPYAPTAVSPAAMGPSPYGPMGVSPAAMGPSPYGPMGVSPAAIGPVPVSPTNVLPTSVAPAQVTPPQEFVNTNLQNTVVPHVHPSHTTTVNQHLFTHKHYFPHTQSVVNQCLSQHLVCPCPPPVVQPFNPCCPPRPFGF